VRAGRGILRRASIAVALAAAGAVLAWVPASAAPNPAGGHTAGRVVYAALGDSYSSGVGTPDPDPAAGACYRTPSAWPEFVGLEFHWETVNLACSGAQTKDVTAQTDLLADLRPRPRVVTITIGGNDVGFAMVLGACLQPNPQPNTCSSAIAGGVYTITNVLPGRLASTYAAVEAADPRARLVVVGYPRLFPDSASEIPGCPVSAADRQALDQAADLLNGVIAGQASLAGATYVDVSRSLSGHEFCTADPWLVLPPQAGAGHPTIEGQKAIAAQVTAVLEQLKLVPSRPLVDAAAQTSGGADLTG
jgi:lysophospholipase L1-like esterase